MPFLSPPASEQTETPTMAPAVDGHGQWPLLGTKFKDLADCYGLRLRMALYHVLDGLIHFQ